MYISILSDEDGFFLADKELNSNMVPVPMSGPA